MKSSIITTTADSISSGGTITGDLTIDGDLTVNGDGSGNYDEIVNGNLVISSGNSLGVGTDNPSTEVHIVSTGTAQVRIQGADASSDARIEFYQSTTAKGFAGFNDSADTMAMVYDTTMDSTKGINIDSAGKIGIGTSSPDTLLHLESSDGTSVLRFSDTRTAQTTGDMGKIEFETFDSGSAGVGAYILGEAGGTGGEVDLAFATGLGGSAAERLRITSEGNVGIGGSPVATWSPNQTITTASASQSSALVLANTNTSLSDDYTVGVIEAQAGAGNRIAAIRFKTEGTSENSGDITFEAGNAGTATERVRITSAGNMGIGATPTAAKLEIHGGGYNTSLLIKGSGAHTGIKFVDSAGNTDGLIYAEGGEIGFLDDDENWAVKVDTDTSTSLLVNNSIKLLVDDNSRISLSNNGGEATNTIFGYQAGNSIHASSGMNTFIGHQVADATMTADADENTAVGHLALSGLTSGEKNIAIGSYSGINITSGDENVLIGRSAGNNHNSSDLVAVGTAALASISDAAADGSVAVGYNSLTALTSGAGNVAVGYKSGLALTSGDGNTAIGYESLYTDDLGFGTTAIGYRACYYQNSDDSDEVTGNTAVGYAALHVNVDGQFNTAVGYQALHDFEADADGHGDNTAVGYRAGKYVYRGTQNTMIGNQAGMGIIGTKLTGDGNTCVGASAGIELEGAAHSNTFVGKSAGNTTEAGTGNVCLGFNTETSADSSTNQTVIGYNATAVADNSVTLGNTDVDAVYMASDSGATVHCGGIACDGGAVFNDSHADVDFRVESDANTHMLFVDGGDDAVGIGTDPDPGYTLVVSQSKTDDQNMVLFDYRTDDNAVDDDDTILLLSFGDDGDATGGHFIEFWDAHGAEMTGTIVASSGTATNNSVSDYRNKENISLITGGLEKIKALKPSYFNYKAYPNKKHQGFIAHEVQEAGIGYAVTGEKDATKIDGKKQSATYGEEIQDTQTFAITNIIPQLVSAVQELTAKVEELEKKIN